MSIFDTIVGAAGDLFSARQTEENQRRANSKNWQMQTRDMDFQREMRSSAYQTMTADLQAAGLNPMLAYAKQGMGGSSSGNSGGSPGVSSNLGSAVAANRQARTQENLADSQVKLTQQNTATAKALQAKYAADAQLTSRKAKLIKPGSDIAGAVGDVTEDAANSGKSLYKNVKESFKNNKPTVSPEVQKTRIKNVLKSRGQNASDEAVNEIMRKTNSRYKQSQQRKKGK